MKELSITVPDIGDNSEAEVIEILFNIGDNLKADDIVIVLESDKATMEIPCEQSGRITSLIVGLGDKVKTGDLVAVLECEILEGESLVAEQQEYEVLEKNLLKNQTRDSDESNIKTVNTKPSNSPVIENKHCITPEKKSNPSQQKHNTSSGIHAGPAARRLARELGVDLSQVKATGRKNRIIKDDIKLFVRDNLNKKAQTSLPDLTLPAIDFTQFGDVKVEALTRIQKVSATHLSRAWLTIPHVSHFDEADITELEVFRKEHSITLKEQGIKLTLLAFFVKAIAHALKKFPRFNASLDPSGENLIIKKYINIGVAVDTDNGLLVPVINDAESKGILQIANDLSELSKKARKQTLRPQDMQGGCFSISSLGGIGGIGFTPIINWPEVAILGISRSQMKPIYQEGELTPRLILPLSLSYDHRVIDGAEAARFCRFVSDQLSSEILFSL